MRKSNDVAVKLYTKLGYVIYRTVINYYSGENEEDAYGEEWWTPWPVCLLASGGIASNLTFHLPAAAPFPLFPFPDMRKAMSRDAAKESMIPLDKPIHPRDLEWG